jgi:hypothetical protein
MRHHSPDAGSTLVASRIAFLEGKTCRVVLANEETLTGVYVNAVPFGRDYYFVFKVGNIERMFKTGSVDEISVIDTSAKPLT